MENNGCCYECKDRKVGCHGTCEKYKTWRKEFEKQRDIAKSKERKNYDYFYGK